MVTFLDDGIGWEGQEEMVGSDSTVVVVSRLKREDCKRTKHDLVFSQWKILVGPCDWEDYSLGKDGAERYRVHNLPTISGPGLYELAIPVSQTGLGRKIGNLDPERMLVVYLGQAENVRTRLQRYGRTGSHLGISCSTAHPTISLQKGPGLFEDILSRGYPIVFRWAPMQCKSDAHKTETQLLKTFDYAWNTSINGSRRPDDILEKLKKVSSSRNPFPAIVRRLLPLSQRQVGIRIKACKLLSTENNFNTCADEESHNILSRVFKFGRSRPHLVADRSGITQENTVVCGVALTHDSVCTRPPVEGRKRCAEHKGMKINGLIKVRISNSIDGPQHGVIDSTKSDGHGAPGFRHDTVTVKYHVSESFSPICGFTLSDGSPCRRQAIQGNKRCDEHKGRRIRKSNSGLVSTEEKPLCIPDVSESNRGDTSEYDHNSAAKCNVGKLEDEVLLSRFNNNKDGIDVLTCGATINNGGVCRRKPVEGNKRCWQHKGMRAGTCYSLYGFESGTSSVTCGVALQNGSTCMRTPACGRKRCEQHKGRRL